MNKVLIQKFSGDVWKEKPIFLQVCKVFCTCFQNPLFLMLAFSFVGFVFLYFLFTSCCCLTNQYAMFWFVFFFGGFLGLVMCYVLGLFLVCLWFWNFFGGFRGQVRWPKGPPQLALNPPYLVCFVFGLFFCLFCFSCWVLFVLLFLLLFF